MQVGMSDKRATTTKDNELGSAPPPSPPPAPKSDEFIKYVTECREKELPDITENVSLDHAGVLIKNLLIAARDDKQPIEIISGEFLPSFYDPLLVELRAALDAGCKVRAISLSEPPQLATNRFFGEIETRGSAAVWDTNNPYAAPHFIVVGDTAYHVESDDLMKTAMTCFNDVGGLVTGALHNRFNEVWGKAVARGATQNDRGGTVGAH